MRILAWLLASVAVAGTAVAAGTVEKFGAPLGTGDAVAVAAVLGKPEAWDGKPVKLTGTVAQVCSKKGCWMTLKDAKNDETVRITFKDYKFFVPKDCSGARATVEGVFAVKTLSAEMARHYAEDAGKDPKAVQGPQRELSVVAAGVELVRNPG